LFLDQLELVRMSDEVKSGYREYFHYQQEQLEILLALYQARGVVNWKDKNLKMVAKKLRRTIDNWLVQQFVESDIDSTVSQFQADVWLEIQAYLTQAGQAEFEGKNV